MLMPDERNQHQIIRKDAKNCFVESLSDSFGIGKAHLTFATYDVKRPEGSRQTNIINIYIDIPELLELCRKLSCGELRYILQKKKEAKDPKPIQEWLGGTSADKLAHYSKPRPDGKSLSRVAKLVAGQKVDFLFIADSGPGETDENGLIVPQFGKNPENHVSVAMTWDGLSELLLMTKTHYEAWLAGWYLTRIQRERKPQPAPAEKKKASQERAKTLAPVPVQPPSTPQPVPDFSSMRLF